MSASTWIRRCFTRHSPRRVPLVHQRKTNPKPSIRLALEALEDRLAPAVLTVNTLVDTVTDPNQLSLREALILVNVGGKPATLGLPSLPAGWTSQISGTFGNNDTIQFAPSLLTQNAGFGYGVIGLTMVGDTTAGPSALGVDSNVRVVGPSQTPGITIERPASAAGVNVPNMRLFYVGILGNLTLDNLTLQGGIAQGGNGAGDGGGGAGLGGAIFNRGILNIQNSLLTGNTAQGGAGSTGYAGGGGGLGGNGQAGEGKHATFPPYQGYGGGPNAGNPNGGPGATYGASYQGVNGGFGGGGSAGGDGKNGLGLIFANEGRNGGFGGGGGGVAGPFGELNGGNGGFGGGGGGGLYAYHYGGVAGKSAFGGGNGTTGEVNLGQFVGTGGGGAGFGGAIFNYGSISATLGVVTLTNTTLTGNRAVGGASPGNPGMGAGGGIFNLNGKLTANYSTLVQNYAAQGGAEIYNLAEFVAGGAVLTLNDSILADSQGSSEDLHSAAINSGTSVVQGVNNLIMSSSGAPTTAPFLVSISDPKLGPLQYNGGPIQTMAPQPGSPVLDAGTNSAALGVTTDARGLPRIYDLPSVSNVPGGDGSDLGAVEVTPATILVNTTSDNNTDPNSLSLRQAVELAEDSSKRPDLTFAQQNLVRGDFGFAATTIHFASSLAGQTIHLASAGDTTFGPSALAITSNITIIGPSGNQGITLAGPGSSGNLRLFRVTPDAILTLENLTLEGGDAVGNVGGNSNAGGGGGGGDAGMGGAILNQGFLTLVNSTLTGNTAQGGAGGRSFPTPWDGGGGGGAGPQGGGGTGSRSGGGAGGAGGGGAGSPGNLVGSAGPGGPGGYMGGGGGGGAGFQGGQGGAGGLGGGGGGGGASSESSSLAGAGGAAGYFGGQGGGGALGGYAGYQGGGGGGGGAGLGGALFNDQGNVTVVNSTFYADKALGGAGGVGFHPGSAGLGAGGALFNYQGLVIVTDSTLADNTAQRGGGIFDDTPLITQSPFVSLTNSIITNSSGGADYDRSRSSGPESVGSHDLIGTNAGFEGGVVSSANPKLSTLGNHGGPTPTLALMPGSPAIDAGLDSVLSFIAQAEGVATAKATDQTGKPRILGTHIDIGAVAYNPKAPTGVDIHGQPSNGIVGQPIGGPITVAVVDANGNTIPGSSQAVTLAIASGPAGAVLGGTTTVDAVNGVATFTNLTLNVPGTYTLTATGGVLTPDFSNPFTISAVNASPTSPAAPALSVPLLLGWFDQLLDGIETVNADGTATVTDSFLGLPLLVSTFDSSGQLENVSFLGINVTFLFRM